MTLVKNRQQDMALGQMIRALHSPNFAEALSHFVRKLVSFDNLIVNRDRLSQKS